jgi:LysR family glycine cleavage system transcriptional activator
MNRPPALPSLNALRTFDAAARSLNVALAAEELAVTHSAVAQQIRALEADLGIQLFTRHAHGLALTQAGSSYAANVGRAFSLLVAATRALRPEPQSLTISVTPSFAGKWLIPRLQDFTERHPQIDLRIVATERLSHFKADAVDLAVRFGRPPFGAGVNAELLFEEVLVAVASAQLPGVAALADGSAPLEAYPLLHDAHDLWPRFFEQGLQRPFATTQRNTRFSQSLLAIDAAAARQGVALAQLPFVARDLADGRLIQVQPFELHTGKGFYLVWPRKGRHPGNVAVVKHFLIAMASTA